MKFRVFSTGSGNDGPKGLTLEVYCAVAGSVASSDINKINKGLVNRMSLGLGASRSSPKNSSLL